MDFGPSPSGLTWIFLPGHPSPAVWEELTKLVMLGGLSWVVVPVRRRDEGDSMENLPAVTF